MSVPVLTRHDPGCKWARFDGTVDEHANILTGEVRPGHSDAAKRFADTVNLHIAAGTRSGWIAVRYRDGSGGDDVFDSRHAAVAHMFPRDREYFYCTLSGGPGMTICQAEALLRFKRVMSDIDASNTDRDQPGGGLEVIPRLANEDIENQIKAVRTGRGFLAMGRRRSRT